MLKEKKQDLTCLALTQNDGERHGKREKTRIDMPHPVPKSQREAWQKRKNKIRHASSSFKKPVRGMANKKN